MEHLEPQFNRVFLQLTPVAYDIMQVEPVLPDGLDQLQPRKVLFTVVPIVINRSEE